MRSLRKAVSLLAVTLSVNTALAQNESAIPAQPGDGPARPHGQDDGFYRASEIIGTAVRGDDGRELGRIQDLLIDRRSQRINYFLLGEGEQLNAQSSLHIVPWTAARPQIVGNDRFVTVKVDQQRWRQAPTYTWQDIQAGPGPWVAEVDRFYGVPSRPGARGRTEVEVERDGDIEIENRNRPRDRDQRRNRGDVEIERDGDVEVNGRNNRPRDGVRVSPNGVEVPGGEGRPGVRVTPGGVEVNPGGNNPARDNPNR